MEFRRTLAEYTDMLATDSSNPKHSNRVKNTLHDLLAGAEPACIPVCEPLVIVNQLEIAVRNLEDAEAPATASELLGLASHLHELARSPSSRLCATCSNYDCPVAVQSLWRYGNRFLNRD
ncbi:hypothetical protein HOD30_03555 [Candidatus Peregrinibacteria bacterium]|jgi:hypothetical protein|nr:hypothetical protein [Candidatus Peregrinibacteria bacterium]MBT4631615.1 hypothetical protein [Candidatus Peregrinibacteria bacterium]MBT5516743.1 hypothetical protein [Candidatus Peregrinibacteria bacterium]MBT5823975.1 hypothetical protein [Candidatus Peregrinibacteria bacterium]